MVVQHRKGEVHRNHTQAPAHSHLLGGKAQFLEEDLEGGILDVLLGEDHNRLVREARDGGPRMTRYSPA